MTDVSDLLPSGFRPSEELMFERAECSDCGARRLDDVRAWAHQHVRETGHAVHLHYGYDVRAEDWLNRIPPERLTELDELRGNPEHARALAEQLLRDSKGPKSH